MTPTEYLQSVGVVFNALSWFSPIITILSMMVFSLFIGAMYKWLFYIGWLIISTAAWAGIRFLTSSPGGAVAAVSAAASASAASAASAAASTPPIHIKNLFRVTYGPFLLAFTLIYIIAPMALAGNVNYGIMGYLLTYLAYDVYSKYCLTTPKELVGDILMGALFGTTASMLMYVLPLKEYLYIDQGGEGGSGGSNGTHCSRPSRNTFRCSVYKNGELVGTHMK